VRVSGPAATLRFDKGHGEIRAGDRKVALKWGRKDLLRSSCLDIGRICWDCCVKKVVLEEEVV
jgi:hypothetical protein